MELTKKQEEGLKIALERYKRGEKYTVISGYAGSGKSTLVKFIIDALNVRESQVGFATFTGKASLVLRNNGNKNSQTLHKLLYFAYKDKKGKYHFSVKPKRMRPDYKIIVVDEVSMVPKKIIEDLMTYDSYIIFLGDPFQLPPISADSNNHLLDKPHVFLDEIMRQAKESEIIRVSMDIREGRELYPFKGKEVQIFDKNFLSDGMLQWADQILTATNKTRMTINNRMRELAGRGSSPEVGDKIICAHNYWSFENPLINGMIGTITNYQKDILNLPIECGGRVPCAYMGFLNDTNDEYQGLIIDPKMIAQEQHTLTDRQMDKLKRNKDLSIEFLDFLYGYAITVHKAQGSQFDKVLVVEEKFPFNKEEHQRWLYTAVTRAIDKCVIIKK